MIDLKDKLLGGLYGLLIGDAVGMPYEFRRPQSIPPLDQIDMIPPEGYNRAWKEVPLGSYTDDGSQALCLLEYYTERQESDVWYDKWAQKLLRWKNGAHLWVDGRSFDMGVQTKMSLMAIEAGIRPLDAARNEPNANGNGSLMRCLPTALWYGRHASMSEFALECERISHITHSHARSKMTCVFYNFIAQMMLEGDGITEAVGTASAMMREKSLAYDMGEWSVIWNARNLELQGTGYVVDCFWSAEAAVRTTDTFEDAIKCAIAFGNDTDTTACVAGGLAGIKYGYSGIPQRWLDQLRGRNLVDPLAQKLLAHHGL